MAADMTTSDERILARKIDAFAWGLLFLWIGIAWLGRFGWGVGLVGVGIITLGAQGFRSRAHVRIDAFAVVIGALFAIVGIWNLFQVRLDLVPLLFIAAGIALLASAWRRRGADGRRTGTGAPAQSRP